MQLVETGRHAGGAVALSVAVHEDDRGWFSEAMNHDDLCELVGPVPALWLTCRFLSEAAVVRGAHFYRRSVRQHRVLECLSGHVDVALIVVDELRADYGACEVLDLRPRSLLYVPPGTAPAIYAPVPSVAQYHTNVGQLPHSLVAVDPRDPKLGINWPSHAEYNDARARPLSEVTYVD